MRADLRLSIGPTSSHLAVFHFSPQVWNATELGESRNIALILPFPPT